MKKKRSLHELQIKKEKENKEKNLGLQLCVWAPFQKKKNGCGCEIVEWKKNK